MKPVVKEFGYFYVIRLVPELDPRRLKLGFADDLNSRLGQHRTAAPTAEIVRSWPCKRDWEGTVIDCLVGGNCRLILNEVFECDELEAMIDCADKLFGLLPDPSAKVLLADISPQNKSVAERG